MFLECAMLVASGLRLSCHAQVNHISHWLSISCGIAQFTSMGLRVPTGDLLTGPGQGVAGYMEMAARQGKCSSLATFMTEASQIAQICLLRGLISGLPTSVWLEDLCICADQATSARSWCLLTEGLLPLACSLAEEASDVHTQFHAQVLVSLCLQQMLDCRQVSQSPAICKQCCGYLPSDCSRCPCTR